ncbi:MAG: 30S ribosomal protein S8 [Patescibacteria group bacterium]|jgi:small subunit ribosomal protein S8
MTDPIADMLTRIRNAVLVNKPEVLIPTSKIKLSIAKILERENYIGRVAEVKVGNFNYLKIELKYSDEGPAIRHIRKISKPGQRIYISGREIPQVLNNFGTAIISTSKGLLTTQEARQGNVGGELMFEIW